MAKRQKSQYRNYLILKLGCSTVVKHSTLYSKIEGSNPAIGTGEAENGKKGLLD